MSGAGERLKKAEEALLASANEDGPGLYEAIWELNTLFPDLPLGDKYALAHDALTSLVENGLIRLERGRMIGGSRRFEALKPEQTEEILKNPTSWYPEYPDNERIGFTATEKGVRTWENRP